MKKLLTLSLVLLFSQFLHAEPGEAQFVAVVGSVDADTGELGMLLMPDFTIPVRVADADIRDANEDPLEAEDITVGMIPRVRGLFTGDASWPRRSEWPIWRVSLPFGASSKPCPTIRLLP